MCGAPVRIQHASLESARARKSSRTLACGQTRLRCGVQKKKEGQGGVFQLHGVTQDGD
jgi:hypothetical protein